MLKGKKIILGVTGGIAVYKAADIVSRLKKQGADVEVIMTEAARHFVDPLTFQTMSLNPVHTSMFNEVEVSEVEHISLAQKSDIILVAPATANTIGKVANGIADNLLTTVIMASTTKVVFAAAMNTFMYNNPMVQDNIEKLEQLGYEFIEPGVGLLACGDYGAGKMAEPSDIVDYVINSFVKKDLSDQKIVITAGPTIEPIDPVRYMTNYSSGKMGYSLAEEAVKRGAEVELVSGPTNLKPPKEAETININTTQEMLDTIEDIFDECDVLIKSAAPADYKSETIEKNKIKKKSEKNDKLNISMIPNPDIAEHFGRKKTDQIVVGFAAESENLIENSKLKLRNKNLDFIVANDITQKGAGFGADTNIVTIIDDKEKIENYSQMDKREVANVILDKISAMRKDIS